MNKYINELENDKKYTKLCTVKCLEKLYVFNDNLYYFSIYYISCSFEDFLTKKINYCDF